VKGYYETERVFSLEFNFSHEELDGLLEDLKFVPDPSEATQDLLGILKEVKDAVE
jgi:hypothetical protein